MRHTLLLLVIFLLTACAGEHRTAQHLAMTSGFAWTSIETPQFPLTTAYRFDGSKKLTVYIEGDGKSWVNRYHPAMDPTPRDPLALRLAALDTAPNVAWLARPCQYEWSGGLQCTRKYWTTARFAPETVNSLNAALDKLKELSGATQLRLVGYSGGGGMAILLAARRRDVTHITTVAGNLDHVLWTQLHEVTPLYESLNPKDYAAKVANIPQVHLIGAKDKVMPHNVARSFAKAAGCPHDLKIVVIPKNTHHEGWTKPDILGRP